MKNILFLLLIISSAAHSQLYKTVHKNAVLVDTHNDVLSSGVLEGIDISNKVKEGHSDFVRWKEGGVDLQFFSVWTGEQPRTNSFYHDALQEIDSLNRLILRNPTRITLALNYKDVKRGLRQGKLVALIGVEGGHMIEDNLDKLESLSKMGMRYLTLTWNNSTTWASSARDETNITGRVGMEEAQKGLTGFGREVVRKMNDLGVIVDLSHVGEKTFYDALATTTKPVILSHSSVWSICPVFRNVKDDQIKAVANNGGVVCINFYSGFISRKWDETQRLLLEPNNKKTLLETRWKYLDAAERETEWDKYYNETLDKVRPTLSELVDHIDYIVKLVGDDYAGIGSDYDGVNSLPIGMDDVSTYPKITEELINRGYTTKSIKKILGGNVLRVMKANFN